MKVQKLYGKMINCNCLDFNHKTFVPPSIMKQFEFSHIITENIRRKNNLLKCHAHVQEWLMTSHKNVTFNIKLLFV